MKLLFVVTAFYPEQAIGSVRITKFVEYLLRKGVEVSVISLTPAPWAMRDEDLYFPELNSLQWIQVNQSSLFNRLLQKARNTAVGSTSAVGYVRPSGARNSLMAMLKSSAQLTYTLLKSFDWVWQVKKRARDTMRGQHFDAIFCSYPSLSSPFAAFALRRLGLSDAVAIDFRDPVSYGSNSRFGLKRFLERRMLKSAHYASFVSEGVKAKVIGEDESDQVVRVITNGFDPDDAPKIQYNPCFKPNAGKLRFVYVGALYGGKRDMSRFFHAARQALEASGYDNSVLEFHYAGGEGELFANQATDQGLAENVIDHGRVSRAESLALQKSSDACLVASWNSHQDKGILTGKVFECFLLEKPVVAVVNGPLGNSELGAIIDHTGAGICTEEADPDGFNKLVDWISLALEEKMASSNLKSKYNKHVSRYSFAFLTDEWIRGLGVALSSIKRRSK